MERTTRRLALTEAGETFHQRMRGALSALQEIEQDTAATAASVRGTLRIALPATFGRMWVAPILPAFLAAHPDVTVEAAFEDRYVDLVAESFDVAIRIGTLTDSRLVARRLAPSRRMLCAAPAYLQARGRPSRPIWLAMPAWVSPPGLASALASARGRQGHVRSHQRPAGHRRCAQPCAGRRCRRGHRHGVRLAGRPRTVQRQAGARAARTSRARQRGDLPGASFRAPGSGQDAGIRRLDLGGAGRQAVAASWIHAAMTYCRQAPHAHMKQSRHRVAAVSIAAMWPWRLALKPRHPA